MLIKRARPALLAVPASVAPAEVKQVGRINKQFRDGQEAVMVLIWRCAAIQSPTKPTLSRLAEALDIHPTTFAEWIRKARIPKAYFRIIQDLYGEALKTPQPFDMEANVELLTSKKY